DASANQRLQCGIARGFLGERDPSSGVFRDARYQTITDSYVGVAGKSAGRPIKRMSLMSSSSGGLSQFECLKEPNRQRWGRNDPEEVIKLAGFDRFCPFFVRQRTIVVGEANKVEQAVWFDRWLDELHNFGGLLRRS